MDNKNKFLYLLNIEITLRFTPDYTFSNQRFEILKAISKYVFAQSSAMFDEFSDLELPFIVDAFANILCHNDINFDGFWDEQKEKHGILHVG